MCRCWLGRWSPSLLLAPTQPPRCRGRQPPCARLCCIKALCVCVYACWDAGALAGASGALLRRSMGISLGPRREHGSRTRLSGQVRASAFPRPRSLPEPPSAGIRVDCVIRGARGRGSACALSWSAAALKWRPARAFEIPSVALMLPPPTAAVWRGRPGAAFEHRANPALLGSPS